MIENRKPYSSFNLTSSDFSNKITENYHIRYMVLVVLPVVQLHMHIYFNDPSNVELIRRKQEHTLNMYSSQFVIASAHLLYDFQINHLLYDSHPQLPPSHRLCIANQCILVQGTTEERLVYLIGFYHICNVTSTRCMEILTINFSKMRPRSLAVLKLLLLRSYPTSIC